MKWFSRKLLVFLIGCGFLALNWITESTWLILAGTYIGTQSIIDLINKRNERKG